MKKVDIDQFIKRSFNDRIHTHANDDEKKYEGLTYECLLPNHDLTFCDFVSTQLRHKLLENSIFQPIDVSNLTKEEFKSLWHIGKVLCDEMENLLHQCGLDWTPSRQARYLRDFTDQEIFAEYQNRKMYSRDKENSKKKELQHDVLWLSKKADELSEAKHEFESNLSAYLDRIVKAIAENTKADLPNGYIIETPKETRQLTISKRAGRYFQVIVSNTHKGVEITLFIRFISNSEFAATMNAFSEHVQDSKCKQVWFEGSCLSIELRPSIDETEQYIRKIVNTIKSFIKERDYCSD